MRQFVFVVDVGFTMQRPVVPDQCFSRVTVAARSGAEAEETALIMVASRQEVVMPTSSVVIDWEEGAP